MIQSGIITQRNMTCAGTIKYNLKGRLAKEDNIKNKKKRRITIAESRDRVNFSSNSFKLLLVIVKSWFTGMEFDNLSMW